MSENMKNLETSRLNESRVFQEADGSIYFWKTVKVQKWNDYLRKYENAPELNRREKITPLMMGYEREMTDKILVAKKIQSEDNLQDSETIFEMEMNYNFKNEEAYRFQYFYRCKRSGRIMVRDFASGCSFSASVNDSQYVSRGKATKLKENSLISRTREIYVINGSSGELELRLPEPTS